VVAARALICRAARKNTASGEFVAGGIVLLFMPACGDLSPDAS
jgi:hypothetical protein